jgi:hypothetical protein
MGLDPQKRFTEVDEDGGVENTVGVEVEVLDAVVLHEPLEEVARRERKSALREAREPTPTETKGSRFSFF